MSSTATDARYRLNLFIVSPSSLEIPEISPSCRFTRWSPRPGRHGSAQRGAVLRLLLLLDVLVDPVGDERRDVEIVLPVHQDVFVAMDADIPHVHGGGVRPATRSDGLFVSTLSVLNLIQVLV